VADPSFRNVRVESLARPLQWSFLEQCAVRNIVVSLSESQVPSLHFCVRTTVRPRVGAQRF
jgi:hypothetical protein